MDINQFTSLQFRKRYNELPNNCRHSYYNWQFQTEEFILNVQITVDRTEFVKLEDHCLESLPFK